MITAQPSSKEEKFHVSTDSFNYDDRTQVINHWDTFCIFDRFGDIHQHGKKAQGIFFEGTRYINQLELRFNNRKPLLLSSSVKQDNEIFSVDLTNPAFKDCDMKENTIYIGREQFIRNGTYYEEISLINYNQKKCTFDLSLTFGADFCDLFEIRGMKRNVDVPETKMSSTDNTIAFNYTGLDHIERVSEVTFKKGGNYSIDKNRVLFHLTLDAQETYKIEYAIYLKYAKKSSDHEDVPSLSEIKKNMRKDIQQTRSLFATINSSNEKFNNWINRSRADLQSLLTCTSNVYYPYAGVPWYNTVFGRDGIITAMEVLWTAPEIARDVLIFLAGIQSKEMNDEKDAEPGKIIHEMRSGEMANTGEVPFKEYYGTIDATPLYLMLAGMYYKQTADLTTIKKIWNNIKAGIEWIDKYGDLDGDGFVEYDNHSEKGLTNQGWKDSYDSIMYANGDLCEGPIALCEVQGYVYSAKKNISLIAKALNQNDYAEKLHNEAKELREKFNKAFWDESLGAFVLALDGNKKPCKVLASNAGHSLFTGIAYPDYAAKTAKQLTSKEMFTGWGIRTLASSEVRYNPMSYHDGSVWPHDNALIAYGLSKYGLQDEILKIVSGLFDASLFIELQRLPELFCGFERRNNEGPTSYPVACSPQAWAVGAVFMLVQACLQLQIDGVHKTLVFTRPRLPEFLEKITITNLKLNDSYCHFEIYRHKNDVSFHTIHKPDDWEIIIKK